MQYVLKEWRVLTSRNYWKNACNGEIIPLVLFSDDVSGNRSKKWNKFDLWAMLLAGLPRCSNSLLENIHFICASNEVDCLVLSKPIVDDLILLEEEGVVMYDALHDEDVIVVAPVLCVLADNARAYRVNQSHGLIRKTILQNV